MPLCIAAGVKLLNFAQIIQKLHGFMGHSIKKMYSSCSDISSVMLILSLDIFKFLLDYLF